MPLRSTVVYPSAALSVQIGLPPTLDLLAAHPEDSLEVVTAVDFGTGDDPVQASRLQKVGVLCRVTDRLYMPGGTVQATVQGLRRVAIEKVEERDGHLVATFREVEETPPPDDVAEDLVARILAALDTLASEVERVSDEVPAVLRMNVGDPGRFADLVATLAHFTVAWKDEVLQRVDVTARLELVLQRLEAELAHMRSLEEGPAGEAGDDDEDDDAPPRDRSADLRRQIRRLEVELGRVDPAEREAVQLLRRIDGADLPGHVAPRARQAVERLRSAASLSEAEEARTYLDWLLSMPWNQAATAGAAAIDLDAVRAALDERLLGLQEPKERLLDSLAVARLRGDLQGPIPCLVGPPDVGKTALAEALAAGLGAPIVRVDLAGRSERELVGTRRTQRDAAPGKLAQAFRDVGACDPVLLLENVDRTGTGKVEGDPVQALEETLRWNDRKAFVDRYLGIELDLSRAVIITTAQDFSRIPRDIRELLVEIRIAGYTPEEKVAIAREKLLPRLIAEHGLSTDDITFAEEPLYDLIRGYARDSGLERVRRVLATILRTRARAKAGGDTDKWIMDDARVEEILGPPRYVATAAENAPEVGVVTGLAWTASGGELLFIEALTMPGSGHLTITGHLGDVMKESVNAAYSYVRSRAAELGIADSDFGNIDVHVHFPVGAVPKDGPSAGVAVTLALASTLSGLPVRHDIAMTGEVTLRGRVLEVGGIKEKVLAGYRAGIRNVILPAGNERDLRDVPEEIRGNIEFFFVERMDEVLDLALMRGPEKKTTARPRENTGEGPDPRDERAARKR
jgi:ATP-dependent Lon protease